MLCNLPCFRSSLNAAGPELQTSVVLVGRVPRVQKGGLIARGRISFVYPSWMLGVVRAMSCVSFGDGNSLRRTYSGYAYRRRRSKRLVPSSGSSDIVILRRNVKVSIKIDQLFIAKRKSNAVRAILPLEISTAGN